MVPNRITAPSPAIGAIVSILCVTAGGPADDGSIAPGDIIVGVNQELLLGLDLKQVIDKLHAVDEEMTLKLADADKVLRVVSTSHPHRTLDGNGEADGGTRAADNSWWDMAEL